MSGVNRNGDGVFRTKSTCINALWTTGGPKFVELDNANLSALLFLDSKSAFLELPLRAPIPVVKCTRRTSRSGRSAFASMPTQHVANSAESRPAEFDLKRAEFEGRLMSSVSGNGPEERSQWLAPKRSGPDEHKNGPGSP